jgi:hypothetical protein
MPLPDGARLGPYEVIQPSLEIQQATKRFRMGDNQVLANIVNKA